MLISALMAVAILAAVGVTAARRLGRLQRQRAARQGPGSSPERAISIQSYTEMDAQLASRRCVCGEPLTRTGEGSREVAGRRLRVARLVCEECERLHEVYFDTSTLRH